jgi:hypothetical protein
MIKKILKGILKKAGYEVNRIPKSPFSVDMVEKDFFEIYEKCRPFTMTSVERMYALYQAVKYVVGHGIAGDFVECGVWKGGSVMLMAATLLKMNETSRNIYLYDTYAGMSKPQERDVMHSGQPACEILAEHTAGDINEFCYATLQEVQEHLFRAPYPREKYIFVKGKVEETIPQTAPERISILRLDSDWYESTYHELKYLFPRLVVGGVIIIDDYGCWKGAREATDQYFGENQTKILLNRIDYTGRIGIKT